MTGAGRTVCLSPEAGHRPSGRGVAPSLEQRSVHSSNDNRQGEEGGPQALLGPGSQTHLLPPRQPST